MELSWSHLRVLIDPKTFLGALVLALIVIILASIACLLTNRLIKRSSWVTSRLKRQVDEMVVRYVVRIVNLLIFIIAAIFYASMVPELRALMGSLMAGAGITALVIGFAAKSTLANLISGLSLTVYRPFHIGDKVTIDSEYGTIEDITLRHTIVKTWQNKRLIIPNGKIDEMNLINYSIIDPRMLCTIELGVSYDTAIDLARRLVLDEAGKCPHRLKDAEDPWMRVISHGDFSIGLRLYVWVASIDDDYQARFWLLENIKKRFDKEGVEIPFPYRTLVYKKDLPPARKEE